MGDLHNKEIMAMFQRVENLAYKRNGNHNNF